MNWFTEHRQRWIAETVNIFGFINREHIVRKFGVSVPQASMDLAEFQQRNPDALRYDLSLKKFVVNRDWANKNLPVNKYQNALEVVCSE